MWFDRKLYWFFMKFSTAFDTINRRGNVVESVSGIDRSLWRCFSRGCGVKRAEGDVPTTMGVRQGCVLSPLLFSLIINNLPEALEGGCNFGSRYVNMLLYAHDMVLINKIEINI